MNTKKPFTYTSKEAKQSDAEFQHTLESQGYHELSVEWEEKLSKSLERDGLEDIERKSGHLKQHDKRTLAWQFRDDIRDFFLELDRYLGKATDLDFTTRRILEAYSQGQHVNDIAKAVKRSRDTVHRIIKRYRVFIRSGQW